MVVAAKDEGAQFVRYFGPLLDALRALGGSASVDEAVDRYNFADIPPWDRLFGTYKDTTEFVERCGFPTGAEEKLIQMLAFKDVYHDDVQQGVPADRPRPAGSSGG